MGDNPLDVSLLLFPIFEVTHIVSFAIAIGTVALVDFRMLGLAMPRQTPGKLMRDTRLWTLIALCTDCVLRPADVLDRSGKVLPECLVPF